MAFSEEINIEALESLNRHALLGLSILYSSRLGGSTQSVAHGYSITYWFLLKRSHEGPPDFLTGTEGPSSNTSRSRRTTRPFDEVIVVDNGSTDIRSVSRARWCQGHSRHRNWVLP